MFYKSITTIWGLFLVLSLVSCGSANYNEAKSPPQIRIVDLDGNPRPVKNYVPEYNAKVLASQGVEINSKTGDLTPIKNAKEPAAAPIAEPAVPVAKAEAVPQVVNVSPSPAPKEEPKSEEKKEEEVEYDLADESSDAKGTDGVNKKAEVKNGKKFKVVTGKDKVSAAKESAVEGSVKKSKTKSGGKGLFIQIGSYSSERVAKEILAKNSKVSAGKIEEAQVHNKKFYRVIIGPAGNQKKAEDLLKKFVDSGNKDAFIIKNK